MRVGFLTLGCKVNYYETEKMKQQFEEAGYMVVAFEEMADVYIVNTCTVTNIADRKSRKMLHRARRRNPEAVIVAAGCYADSAGKREEKDESIDLFVTNEEKAGLEKAVSAILEERNNCRRQAEPAVDFEEKQMTEGVIVQKRTRAYLKIQDGCNQYCTYCIIPYVRGPLKSRRAEEIVKEAEILAQEGVHEIVITGIHLSSYGVDLSGKKSFLELEGKPLLLLLKAVARVEGIERIRLGSLEPRIVTEEFVKELADIPEICPQFHLSLQSGCDEVLRRMNRHYTTTEYLMRLQILRRYFIHPAITTDIIVGFPGETEEEFRATCAFAREAAFAKIHVFKYSRRKGTMADAMEGQLTEGVKAERSDVLLKIALKLEQDYQDVFLSQKEKVLFEEITQIQGQAYLVGYNERYVRIAVPAQVQNAEQLCNTIAEVRIQGRITDEVMQAEQLKPDREQ